MGICSVRRIILIFLLLCFLYPIHFLCRHHNNSNPCLRNASNSSRIGESKRFEILKHPVRIVGARNLVKNLRDSSNYCFSAPPPLTLKFRDITFGPESMEPCTNSAEDPIDLFIMIKSGTENEAKRKINRDSWANSRYLSKFGVKIKYAFIMGEPGPDYSEDYPSVPKEVLTSEASEYGDIIIGDFTDTYKNVTYKTMAGYKWVLDFCPHFKFYVSLDDDTYISISNLLRFLESPRNYTNKAFKGRTGAPTFIPHEEHLYAGSRASISTPNRDKKLNWYLSPEEYPFSKFPPYLLGYFLLLSRETVESFYYISPYIQALTIDDLYLGELANELRISVLHMGRAVITEQYIENISLLSCDPTSKFSSGYVALHNFGRMEVRSEIWNMLNCLNDLKNGWPAQETHGGL